MSPEEGVLILRKWHSSSQSLMLYETSRLGLPPCEHRVNIQSVDLFRLALSLEALTDGVSLELPGAQFVLLTPGGSTESAIGLYITFADGRGIALKEIIDGASGDTQNRPYVDT